MNRPWRVFVAVGLVGCLAGLGGCGGPGKRPVVRGDDDGRIVSKLVVAGDVAEVTLPLEAMDRLLVTDAVRINGRSVGPMLIDTGAAWTTIDRATAARLGIGEGHLWRRRKNDDAPDGMYRVESLDVGAVGLRNHALGVLDFSSVTRAGLPIAGVVGGDVFGALPFTFDYEKRTLAMHARAGFRPPPGAEAYRVRVNRTRLRGSYTRANPQGGHPLVEGRIDGVGARLLVDTGFAGGVTLEPWFAKKHPRFADQDGKVIAKAVGAGGPRGLAGRELRRARVGHVDALGARFRDTRSAAVLSPAPQGHHVAAKPDAGVIGLEYLRHGTFTFDYGAGRVWVQWRDPATPPPMPRPARTGPHPATSDARSNSS